MMTASDLLRALGPNELILLFWLTLILDVPRYLLATLAVALAPGRYPRGSSDLRVSAIVSCYNEQDWVLGCVRSLQAAGADQIIVVNDGSTDDTAEVLATLGVQVLTNTVRQGKPASINSALSYCLHELVLIVDADTQLEPNALTNAKPYFANPLVGGVGLHLAIRNLPATLTTRLQAIEYAVAFTAGRQLADAISTLPNISGAAGLFRKSALTTIGGLDVEVAEDAALAMKLRQHNYQLRYANNAIAWTTVPETPDALAYQRLRWDASIITIYWRKFGFMANPFTRNQNFANLATILDVLVFAVLLQFVFPVYLFWLWTKVGVDAFILLGAVMLVLAFLEVLILLLVALPPTLLLFVPLHLLVQMTLLRPWRIFALSLELTCSITHYDDYIPAHQRWRLT